MKNTLNMKKQMFFTSGALKNKFLSLCKKNIHYQKAESNSQRMGADSHYAHSPLNISRGKIEEYRSKIFYETPQIPNRMPKYFFLFCIIATTWAAYVDKSRRRQKQYLREEERLLFKQISPFCQAMEDLRFTAIEQRNYMINKAVADQYSPELFEHLRERFTQNDIFIDEMVFEWRNIGSGNGLIESSGSNPYGKRSLRTYQDKGLYDNREVGFVY